MVSEVAGPRDICQAVLTARFSKRHLATALRVTSSTTTGHYILNKGRRGSKPSGFRKQCYEGKHNRLTLNDTAGVTAVAAAAASRRFIFREPLILRLSEIRPIPWFLTEGQVDERI